MQPRGNYRETIFSYSVPNNFVSIVWRPQRVRIFSTIGVHLVFFSKNDSNIRHIEKPKFFQNFDILTICFSFLA